METLNYKVLEGTGYNGYILKDAPVKVMQFGEGNFLRAFVDYFYDIANEKAGYNGKVKLVQPIGNFPQMADWINDLCDKCGAYAADWQPVADEIWSHVTLRESRYENYKDWEPAHSTAHAK